MKKTRTRTRRPRDLADADWTERRRDRESSTHLLPTKPASAAGPSLRFTPAAWAKLLFLRDAGPTEVGGFGVSAADDPLLVTEVHTVRQDCTPVYVRFEDAAVADYFDEMVDRGLRPDRFVRIWIHTHPGDSAEPTLTDEETFARVFGRSDWAVMFILAQAGQTSCRLECHVGPGVAVEIPVRIDFGAEFGSSDREGWQAEYRRNVFAEYDLPQRVHEELDAIELLPDADVAGFSH